MPVNGSKLAENGSKSPENREKMAENGEKMAENVSKMTPGFRFLIMEKLGSNLADLRKNCEGKKFDVKTALTLCADAILCLEGMHDAGFVHRDVKPSNFAMGLGGGVHVLDFGLARKYLDPSGAPRPARPSPGFRGTTRYASIHAHLDKDLGRRDDLWSVLYMTVEFINGSLPWSKIRSKDEVASAKMYVDGPELVQGLPPCLLSFMRHLNTLSFADRPDYTALAAEIATAAEVAGWQSASGDACVAVAGLLLTRLVPLDASGDGGHFGGNMVAIGWVLAEI
eukprot:TRINITY_DN20_c1_g1_i5.p1 TRINITY_DN20_c1_g1~~TRINITY_DN20_c1_g1_i5.p1  ORF type:complete len:282 (-),score=43.22 TRINITY_DN20_c1_g1_i5:169-1014(-)